MASCRVFLLMIVASIALLIQSHATEAELPASSFLTGLSASEYWARTIPGVALPAALQERITTPAVSPAALLNELHATLSGRPTRSQLLCRAAHLYCDPEQFAAFRTELAACTRLIHFRQAGKAEKSSLTRFFFTENALVANASVALGAQQDRAPTAPFLPRHLAQMLHPANERLLQGAFGIPAVSLLSKESMGTSRLCEAKGQKEQLLENEEAFCALSLEDLADQLAARFSSANEKPEVLPVSLPQSAAGTSSVAAKLLHVELRAADQQPYLACHARTYPFAVFFCHHIPNTRVYSATLQTLEDEPELFRAVATCHLDTSGWSYRHAAFADLHSSPGRTEACHWNHEHSLVFVPVAN